MTLIIGLTGSIASGKGTVSSMLQDINIPVIDADKIAREVVNPGEKAYSKIIDLFGEKVLHDDRSLNRKKLGSIIFSDEEKRVQLNEIVHPEIREEMLQQRDAYIKLGVKCVVLDIPLLFESNLGHFVEKIIVVYVDEEVQLQRLMQRDDYNKKEAEQRISAQIPVQEKVKLADAVIDNNGTIEETYLQVEKLLQKWNAI